MSEVFPYTQNFVSISVFEAIYRTEHSTQNLLWESRTTPDGEQKHFTIVDGQEVRAGSIREFMKARPAGTTLSIEHTIRAHWNGTPKVVRLVETFVSAPDADYLVEIKLNMIVDGVEYETEGCDTLTDAIWELHEIVGLDVKWRLQTCYHCNYAYPAFPGPGFDDRDGLRCYRDDQEAFKKVQRDYKDASTAAKFGGNYFVNAFHSCAAWKPLVSRSGAKGNG